MTSKAWTNEYWDSNCPWDKPQVKAYASEILRDIGDGWKYMVPDVKRAFVAQKAFAVVRSQDFATVTPGQMTALLNNMLWALGLE